MCLENSQVSLIVSAHLLELEQIALFTRALQTRLSLLLFAVTSKKMFAKQINNINKWKCLACLRVKASKLFSSTFQTTLTTVVCIQAISMLITNGSYLLIRTFLRFKDKYRSLIILTVGET